VRRKDRELTEKTEMADVLQRGDVCHLALVDGAKPYIVALNYGFEWQDSYPVLYFHCALSGKKIDILTRNNAACFMVDVDHLLVTGEKGCDWGMQYKSVVGSGNLEQVRDTAEKKKALDLLMLHHSGRSGFDYDEKICTMTLVLKMVITDITGKKKD